MYNVKERVSDKMNITVFVIIALFVILIVFGIIVISIYSKLTFYKKKVIDKFETINDCLKDIVEIIRGIISIIGGDNFHEDSLIMELNILISKIENEKSINTLLLLIDESYTLINRALNINTIYSELNNNSAFMDLRDKFNNNHYKLMYAVDIYNEEVEAYNNYKNNKFNGKIAKKFKFEDYNYYKKSDDIQI